MLGSMVVWWHPLWLSPACTAPAGGTTCVASSVEVTAGWHGLCLISLLSSSTEACCSLLFLSLLPTSLINSATGERRGGEPSNVQLLLSLSSRDSVLLLLILCLPFLDGELGRGQEEEGWEDRRAAESGIAWKRGLEAEPALVSSAHAELQQELLTAYWYLGSQ